MYSPATPRSRRARAKTSARGTSAGQVAAALRRVVVGVLQDVHELQRLAERGAARAERGRRRGERTGGREGRAPSASRRRCPPRCSSSALSSSRGSRARGARRRVRATKSRHPLRRPDDVRADGRRRLGRQRRRTRRGRTAPRRSAPGSPRASRRRRPRSRPPRAAAASPAGRFSQEQSDEVAQGRDPAPRAASGRRPRTCPRSGRGGTRPSPRGASAPEAAGSRARTCGSSSRGGRGGRPRAACYRGNLRPPDGGAMTFVRCSAPRILLDATSALAGLAAARPSPPLARSVAILLPSKNLPVGPSARRARPPDRLEGRRRKSRACRSAIGLEDAAGLRHRRGRARARPRGDPRRGRPRLPAGEPRRRSRRGPTRCRRCSTSTRRSTAPTATP